MKNPFRSGPGMTSGRACAVYALIFVLMLFLDAGRFSGFLDRAGVDFEPAAALGQVVKEIAGATGLAALSESETRLVAELSPEWHIGAVQGAAAPGASAVSDMPSPLPIPSAPAPVSSVSSPVTPPSVPSPVTPSAPSVVPEPEAVQPESPLRAGREKPLVLLVGDSMMMEGFGPVLQRTLRKRPDMDVVREGKYSTGLSRQDYFDWPGHLAELVEQYAPDIIVICMGANDAQDIIDENRKRHHADSESWKELYRSRSERLLAIATAKGAKVVWAGLPIMGKEPYATRIRRLSDLQRQACQTYRAVFVDTVKTLADGQGNYTTFTEGSKGQHVRLRYKDMVHVTEDGGAMLAAAVEPAVEKTLGLVRARVAASPASSAPAPIAASVPEAAAGAAAQGVPFSVDSAQRGEKVACYAFLPANSKPGERFPVVYLLHGASESGESWGVHMGAELKRLATRERLIFIAPSCGKAGWYVDSPYQKKNRMESFLVRELLPQVERTFPVLPLRGVMGFSMGGHGAFALALRHPGLFASVSSMSGLLDITRYPNMLKIQDVLGPLASNTPLWESYSAIKLLGRTKPSGAPAMLVTTGQQDTNSLSVNRAFREVLRKGGFAYQYREAPGVHDWSYWREELPLHVAFHAGVLNR